MKGHPKFFVLALVPLLLVSCGALWQTDSNRAIEEARTGNYKAAADVLERVVEDGKSDPQIVESLYYSWIRQGEYSKARSKFEAWADARPNDGPVRLAAGRIDRITGNYAKSLTYLNSVLNFAGISTAAQLEKAKVLDDTGKRDEAAALYKKILDAYQNGMSRSSSDLLYVAEAMWAGEYFQDANDVLKLAVQANARNAEALVVWGDLLAAKYNEPEAIASYQDALKIDPNMPEANLGIAKGLALTEPEKSQQALDLALSVNKNFPDGELMQANQLIDSEEYDKAEAPIGRALEINPQSVEAFSLLASINYLRGNKAGVRQVRQEGPGYQSVIQRRLLHACGELPFGAPVPGGSRIRTGRAGNQSEGLEVHESSWCESDAYRS